MLFNRTISNLSYEKLCEILLLVLVKNFIVIEILVLHSKGRQFKKKNAAQFLSKFDCQNDLA